MLKQVTVTFNFDPETEYVSDLTCFVDGVEKKKKTTRSTTKEKEITLEDEALISLQETKLQLNNKAVADMGIVYGDRLIIKYEKLNKKDKKAVPIIGKDIDWNSEGNGNKITKTNSIAYKGKNNTFLAQHGTEFTIEPYKDSLWIMVSKNPIQSTYEEVVEEAEETDLDIYVDDNDNDEISEMLFKF